MAAIANWSTELVLSVFWPRNLPTLKLWVTLCFLEECFKVLFFKVLCYFYYVCLNSNQEFDCLSFSLSFRYAPTWPMAWSHSACPFSWVLHMQARLEYESVKQKWQQTDVGIQVAKGWEDWRQSCGYQANCHLQNMPSHKWLSPGLVPGAYLNPTQYVVPSSKFHSFPEASSHQLTSHLCLFISLLWHISTESIPLWYVRLV